MPSVERVPFVLSVAVLAFFYGFGSRAWGWVPRDLLGRAGDQAVVLLSRLSLIPPDYTGARVYDRTGARTVDADRIQPGLTLVVSIWREGEEGGWKPGLRLIDQRGRIEHEWKIDPTRTFPDSVKRRGIRLEDFDIQGSHLFPDGDVLVNIEYLGTARLDACGRVEWTLAEGNHHSVARDADGSFWIPGLTHRTDPTGERYPDGLPGLVGTTYRDRILRVSEDGRVIEDIDVLEVLYANGLERHIFQVNQQSSGDITHLNDVEPLDASMADEYPSFEEGDLLVSLRHLNLVLVFDPKSREVKWHTSDPFIYQHDPDFLGNGWIGVFDNRVDRTERGSVLGGSRILALQPHTGSEKVLFPTSESEPFYTEMRGKWQRLDNGNMLLTEAAAGRIVEVTPEGRTVWEWVAEPYNEDRTPLVSKGLRLDLTREQVRSWPCSPRDRQEEEL